MTDHIIEDSVEEAILTVSKQSDESLVDQGTKLFTFQISCLFTILKFLLFFVIFFQLCLQHNQHQKPLNCRRKLLRLKIQNFQVKISVKSAVCLQNSQIFLFFFFSVENLKCPKKLAMTISQKLIPLDDQLEQDLLRAAQVSEYFVKLEIS